MEQPPEASRPIGVRDGVQPSTKQRLAFGIDKDVRPPQRVLDELEPLGGALRGHRPDLLKVGEDLLV